MLESIRKSALVVALVAAASPLALAGGANAIYRLDEGSDHTAGCLPPCKCPIAFLGEMRGTFTVEPIAITQFVQRYAIENVNWTVFDTLGNELSVKGGNGEFVRSSTFTGISQQLTVELSIDGGPLTKFDSGVVAGSSFPVIDVAIADNGFVCNNQVFNVNASEVPLADVTHYSLAGTEYQEGCFPPCLCPITSPRKVVGSFDLVLLDQDPFVTRYSITNLSGFIQGPLFASAKRRVPFSGVGDYRIVAGGGPLPLQDMTLCLEVDGVEQDPFTGSVFALPPFGSIELVLSQNGMVCFDRVFDLMATAKVSLPPPVWKPAASVGLGAGR